MRLILTILALVFLLCSSSEVESVHNSNDIYRIHQPDGSCFYIRNILINGISLYYRCDEQGNIFSSSITQGRSCEQGPISTNSITQGKSGKVLLETE